MPAPWMVYADTYPPGIGPGGDYYRGIRQQAAESLDQASTTGIDHELISGICATAFNLVFSAITYG